MSSSIFADLTGVRSSTKMQRKEDQLTAVFIAVLKLCPNYRKDVFKRFLRSFAWDSKPTFSTQDQVYDSDNMSSRRADAKIEFGERYTLLIENKLDAPLYSEQVQKYKNAAYGNHYVWFIYKKRPSELDRVRRKNFITTRWGDIYEHLYFYKNGKEGTILDEFKRYLEEGIGMDAFVGIDKDALDIWKESTDLMNGFKEFLNKYKDHIKERRDMGGWKYKIKSNPSVISDGREVWMRIERLSKKYHFGKQCYLYIGFLNGDSSQGGFWQSNEPVAYIHILVRKEELDRIQRRGSAHKGKIGLSIGGFEEIKSKGNAKSMGMAKKEKISKLISRSKKKQYEELERFFDRGLRVAETHIFHELERYR